MEHADPRRVVGTVVVGAGQAGLSLGYFLKRAGVDVLLLERSDRVGSSWSRRWTSLTLFTPAGYDALPGTEFPGDRASYPGKDAVAAYLARYADDHGLPVRTGAEVVELTGGPGTYELTLRGGERIVARQVVIATGAFGVPVVPALAAGLDPAMTQLHTDAYRDPDQVPAGTVLVVGGGNSGFQVAQELARAGRSVALSEGARLRTIPQRILGRDVFWWLSATRAIAAPATSWVGARLRANDPIIGSSRRQLRRDGVVFHGRTDAADGRRISFADGRRIDVDAVVWATGYRHDDRWVRVAGVLGPDGALVAQEGITASAGLFTIGRPWQRDRGSALLGFVGRDARRLSEVIVAASRSAM